MYCREFQIDTMGSLVAAYLIVDKMPGFNVASHDDKNIRRLGIVKYVVDIFSGEECMPLYVAGIDYAQCSAEAEWTRPRTRSKPRMRHQNSPKLLTHRQAPAHQCGFQTL